MTRKQDISRHDTERAGRQEAEFPYQVGDWAWFQNDDQRRLGCVTHIGSNVVEVTLVGHYRETRRVRFDTLHEYLVAEPNAGAIVRHEIQRQQQSVQKLLGRVNELTQQLGVSPRTGIEQQTDTGGQALAVLSGQNDVKAYEKALVRAKEETLPDLFKQIEKHNKRLSAWMTAETIPLVAMGDHLKKQTADIDDRIFNVSLYAGLTETVTRVADGEPAGFDEPVHVLQRRLYMDEECLLDYQAGGMEFQDIHAFDEWLAKPNNRDRVLPFPRCVVAMRVRRRKKDRDWGGSLLNAFINIQSAIDDQATFLYLRNGEQLHRLACDMDFGEMLFPDKRDFDPGSPMYVKMWGEDVRGFMSAGEYEERVREAEDRERKADEWTAKNPTDNDYFHNPYRSIGGWREDEWELVSPDHLYYDEIEQHLAKEVREYNRVALILQGLLDRSPVFHPHPPAKLWTPQGFEKLIRLVYDASNVLHYREAPDFEDYRARLNASLQDGSVTVGQQLQYEIAQAEKECERMDRDWRTRDSDYRPRKFLPLGNPGPGLLAEVLKYQPRAKRCQYAWHRERQTSDRWDGKFMGDPIRTTFTCYASSVLNVDAYRPGDFRQFFEDPRTRADYLKWAPLLLTAEDYHAGKIEVSKAVPVGR